MFILQILLWHRLKLRSGKFHTQPTQWFAMNAAFDKKNLKYLKKI